MANEVRIPINVTGEDQAARDLKKVGDAAERAGESIEELGEQSTAAGKATEKAGDDFKKAGDDVGFLDKQVIETREHLKELIRELDRTGDTSLLKDIRKDKRSLRQFENLAKELTPDIASGAAKAGLTFGEEFAATAGTTISRAGPYVAAGLAAAAAAATPGLGALVAAAVVGGVGAGGIVGGIALAAQDPRLQQVAGAVGESLLGEFRDAARPFVDPLIDALGKISDAGWAGKLAPGFEKLAESIGPLTDGLIRFGDEVVDGLNYAFEHAGPLLDVLAAGLPRIGDAISDVIKVLASDTEGAQIALDRFIDAVVVGIEVTGGLIYGLMQLYEAGNDVSEALGFVSEEQKSLIKFTGGAGKSVEVLAKQTEEAEKAMRDFDKAISAVFNRTLGVREATLGYEQAIDDLVEQLTDGKRTLDENTQAGRDNWASINDTARAIEELREANVANGMSMEDAGKQYDAQLEDLRKTLLGLGYNKKAVNDYIDELKRVPKQALTEIHLKGIKQALRDIKDLASAIGAVTGYAILSVASNLGKRASGGPVVPGGNYIVGENGPELLTMKPGGGGHVYSASQTASMVGTAAGGSVAGVNVYVMNSDRLTQAIAESLRFEVRTTANGDANEYFS